VPFRNRRQTVKPGKRRQAEAFMTERTLSIHLDGRRMREITFLEPGLLIGRPEHGADADRATRDLPSIRMLPDYFPQARIHGLDVSDFAGFAHDRSTFHRCDMEDPDQITRANDAVDPAPEIVIGDVSHLQQPAIAARATGLQSTRWRDGPDDGRTRIEGCGLA
jgi:hypothetical protein